MEKLTQQFNKKVKSIIPEEQPFSEPKANSMMSPEKWISKYGKDLSIEEIKEKFELSDTEIQDLQNKARGVV